MTPYSRLFHQAIADDGEDNDGDCSSDNDDDDDDDDGNDDNGFNGDDDGDNDNNNDGDNCDDGDDDGGDAVGDDDDDDDNDGDDLASLYRHTQTGIETRTPIWWLHWVINWQYKVAICRVYIYPVFKNLVIRLSGDLIHIFHNTKQIRRSQVEFLQQRKSSDQNDLLENLQTNLGIVF